MFEQKVLFSKPKYCYKILLRSFILHKVFLWDQNFKMFEQKSCFEPKNFEWKVLFWNQNVCKSFFETKKFEKKSCNETTTFQQKSCFEVKAARQIPYFDNAWNKSCFETEMLNKITSLNSKPNSLHCRWKVYAHARIYVRHHNVNVHGPGSGGSRHCFLWDIFCSFLFYWSWMILILLLIL